MNHQFSIILGAVALYMIVAALEGLTAKIIVLGVVGIIGTALWWYHSRDEQKIARQQRRQARWMRQYRRRRFP